MKTMLYFSAPWCGPCKTLAPIVNELSSQINVRKINVDNDTELASKFGITTTNLNKIDFHEEFFGIYPPDAVDTYALESEKYELPYPDRFKKIKVEYIQEDPKGLWKGFDVGYVFYGYSL